MRASHIIFAGLVAAGCASGRAPAPSSQSIEDSIVTARVKTLIAHDARLAAEDINVTTRGGVVQLSGFVESRQAAERVAQLAQGIEGVHSVDNHLQVDEGR